jgi:hypothetical protein
MKEKLVSDFAFKLVILYRYTEDPALAAKYLARYEDVARWGDVPVKSRFDP